MFVQALQGWTADGAIHVAEFGLFIIGVLSYRDDRRKTREAQLVMHAENRGKLESLESFERSQHVLNGKRDEQISILMQQSATLIQMQVGQERRLQMLEDRI